MYSLKTIREALLKLKQSEDRDNAVQKIKDAEDIIARSLLDLDAVGVVGRQNVDTLLGCMMALEAIIGKDGGDNG